MNEAYIISAAEYAEWVANWNEQEHAKEPYPFFIRDKQVQTGVAFPFSSLSYLFSAVGVVTIKVRFGVSKATAIRPEQFHPILFGVDNTGTIITPYFISTAPTYRNGTGDTAGEGNLPLALMELWKTQWHTKAEARKIGTPMFQVNPQLAPVKQGFLQGYSYSVKEMMAALGTLPGAASIHLMFGLHEYYSMPATPADELTSFDTFGLILYAATDDGQQGAGGGVVEDSGYYDFSAPCPFTC